MSKIYGYIRVSTETQADKGYGLETQRNTIIKYCKNNNLELIKIFKDEGISGAIGDNDDISKRQGLVELLNTAEESDIVIVMNTSRLWRDDAAKVFIAREIKKLKGDIISIEQPKYSLYSKDPTEFLINSIIEILDQYDRMTINMKLSKGRMTKAYKGTKPAGRLPFGYKYSADKKSVEINEKQKPIVNEVFHLASEDKSLQQITDIINAKGYVTKNNKPWTKSSIYNMLNNDFYIGVVTHVEKIQGKHQPIVSIDLWNSIHEQSED